MLNMNAINYSKILNPTETEKLIRSHHVVQAEGSFWKKKLQECIGLEGIKNLEVEFLYFKTSKHINDDKK